MLVALQLRQLLLLLLPPSLPLQWRAQCQTGSPARGHSTDRGAIFLVLCISKQPGGITRKLKLYLHIVNKLFRGWREL